MGREQFFAAKIIKLFVQNTQTYCYFTADIFSKTQQMQLFDRLKSTLPTLVNQFKIFGRLKSTLPAYADELITIQMSQINPVWQNKPTIRRESCELICLVLTYLVRSSYYKNMI